MVVGSYIPRWVTVFDGTQEIKSITFAVNRLHASYASNVDLKTTVDSIATAPGWLGPCSDYLMQTVDGLMSSGIKDRQLLILRDLVVAR